MKPVVSVKELMHDMIDPLADNIFDAVGTTISGKGVVEKTPKTDEDWEKVTAIVCRILERRIGSGRLRGQELTCVIANASMSAADVTAE